MLVVEISFRIRDGANVIHKADYKGDVKLLSRLKTRLPRQNIPEGIGGLKFGIASHRSYKQLRVNT